MRLSTDESRDETLALGTIAAAAEAGVTVFDTARAYGRGAAELGHNERLLARALRRCGAEGSARIVTKGGMTRTGGGWIPDGRARSILGDCEASLAALDGLAIDLYLIHAPDPRTPWRTSVRALARLVDEGVVRHVGLANVNRRQLDEALELAPVTAVQVALSPYDDRALRGGVLERCAEMGIAVIAHSPLGGPRRAGGLARQQALADLADARGATPAEVALAWVLDLSSAVVAIPGARRPETARSAGRAATLDLDAAERAVLARAFGRSRPARLEQATPSGDVDVVLVMGIPGAGKSRVAEEYVARGYLRLNRDERGGSLRELADALDEELSAGVRRIVLDNTYLTRAARSYVIEAASRHRVPTRCVWLDTPLAQAQVNLVERLLERFGSLPTPEELRGREPGVLAPTSQMRALRELEPPSTDEGLAGVEQVPFVRTPASGRARTGVFVAAAALRHPAWKHPLAQRDRDAPHLVFDWKSWRPLVPQLLAVAGNMDSAAIDARLAELGVALDGRGVAVGDVGLFGVSAAPISPLHTPYELDDDELERRIERGYAEVAGCRLKIFCPHAPPRDTACDRLASGEHVGSAAIRAFVEREQPDVVLCGHIHEARGRDEIGSSKVVNPGPARAGHYALLEVAEEITVSLDGRA